ncbi:Trans-enoyl reductase fsl5 [Conoideocrella luteorostrata]|uniref:Trans-enoyl reductase fsl5 n=1 Tax=Conoideocrella luteorostrata TaxID=1105319 RepID=A0AAJ0CHP4_9HYPO|nr:Trans-enoyl reductase fsl5 [Conoideocrella luteorostrata]
MPQLPSKQTAIIGREDGILHVSDNVNIPDVVADMILVKTAVVALNPIDTKMVGDLAAPGAIAGMDFAGEVVSIGSNVRTAKPIKIGDKVCGAVPGMHSLSMSVGAFAQYVGASDINTLKIPSHMSIEQAATLGSGVGTIGLALFKSLNVPASPSSPAQSPMDVLVYGGSTSTGTLAIQLPRLSGLRPIATSSPHNFDLVKSFGAAAVFDYHQENCVEDIRKFTRNSLKFVLDCVSEPETMQFCYRCLGRTGGKYTALEPTPDFLHNRPKTVVRDWVLGPVIIGKRLSWPEPFAREPNASLREFGSEWFSLVQDLLDKGDLKPHPHKIVDGGFEGLLNGLEVLKRKEVSGFKLVCRIS